VAKIESFGSSLLPVAVAAGLLSGGVIRTSPSALSLKPRPAVSAPADSSERNKAAPTPLTDVRPIIELLGQSLGVSVEPDETLRALRALRLDRKSLKRSDGLAAALDKLERFQATRSPQVMRLADESPLQQLDAYLRTDVDSGAQLHKLQSSVANRLFEELRDEDALAKLAAFVAQTDGPSVDVQFMIATIPDYVDSNSGWMADEVLGAIQAAMGRANFLLDRFRLIDWLPADESHPDRVNESKQHERQPGALVFRKVRPNAANSGKQIRLQVVLLVLETPTAGVHRVALKNAMTFVSRWNDAMRVAMEPATDEERSPIPHGEQSPILRLVAPVFSGSMPSLALELRNWKDPSAVKLITGSAMADVNATVVERFAPGVTYQATVQPTSAIMHALGEALGSMNADWATGKGVALLVEGNTAYGNSATPGSNSTKPGSEPAPHVEPFQPQFRYPFPLHVAELRSDGHSSTSAQVSLVPAPIVPLSLREATPPADQLPALRPQLTTPVVEATLDSILDNIKHEDVSAVGIVATDSRDVLFLAREVKQHAPDVQLFFAGSYLLYLHPEYIPYTRGAIVAAPYPLSLNVQRGIHAEAAQEAGTAAGGRPRRPRTLDGKQPFTGMIAGGVFNATLIQLNQKDRLIDYCDPAAHAANDNTVICAPPVWVSVIGDDGYWPLTRDTKSASFVPSFAETPAVPKQVPMPGTAKLIASLGGLLVAGLVWASVQVCLGLKRGDKYYVGFPLVRELLPPVTFRPIGWLRALMLLLGGLGLSCLSAWFAAILILQWWTSSGADDAWRPALEAVAWTVFALVLAPSLTLVWKSLERTPGATEPSNGIAWPWWSVVVIVGCSALVIGAFAAFLVFIHTTIHVGDIAVTSFRIQRYIAGGIVSPAPSSICLFAALAVGLIATARRLSMVGRGYTALAQGSPAFRLLTGGPLVAQHLADQPAHAGVWDVITRRFTALVDMPVHNLPAGYFIAIVTGLMIAAFSVRSIATIEGLSFSLFVQLTSFAVLIMALLLVAQAAAIWGELQPKLALLVRTRIDRAMGVAGSVVRWELSITPPRLGELMPMALLAVRLRDEILGIANRSQTPRVVSGFPDRRLSEEALMLATRQRSGVFVRQEDLCALHAALSQASPREVQTLHAQIVEQPSTPLLQSSAWEKLWRFGDGLTDLLERIHWKRCCGPGCPGSDDETGTHGSHDTSDQRTSRGEASTERWFAQCEEFVALQYAFLLRDVVARIMSALFAAMLCLTLLTASHLFYLFQGRSSLLTIDLFAVGIAAIVALRIVIGLERDTIISRLRVTTPGRIDFNWDFLKRVGIYGVLPLLAVIGSLFPEIGDSFFGWLEPLRKLAAF